MISGVYVRRTLSFAAPKAATAVATTTPPPPQQVAPAPCGHHGHHAHCNCTERRHVCHNDHQGAVCSQPKGVFQPRAAMGQRRMYSTPPPEPETPSASNGVARKKTTVLELRRKQKEKEPITMLTAYDYPTARIMDEEGVDMILVGDSVGMVVHGLDSTVPVGMEEMLLHSKAVRRGAPRTFVVGDMPFGSYEVSPIDAAKNAIRFAKEAGVDAVKLEGGKRVAPAVEAIANAGVLAIGHIGLTPQSSAAMGGFRVQGKSVTAAKDLLEDAKALEKAGACALVVEGVPPVVADYITKNISIPTIGIGAGSSTTGQVLVLHDMAGLNPRKVPKFCKRFADTGSELRRAIRGYVEEVGVRKFPSPEHEYGMPKAEREKMEALLGLGAKVAPVMPSAPQPPVLKEKRLRVAIVGGGAMGSFVAGSLARTGTADVCMISAWSNHVQTISERGLRLDALGGVATSLITTIQATHSPEQAVRDGPFDVVFILVKSPHTAEAAEKAALLVDPNQGCIVSLQNGMGNREVIANVVSRPDMVVQGITTHGAMMEGAGHVRHMGMGVTTLALPDNAATTLQRVGGVARLLTLAGIEAVTQGTEEMQSMIWGKLCINAGINPLSALLRVSNGALAENPQYRELLAETVREAAGVAKAKGVTLPFESAADAAINVARQTAGNRSSMLCDVLRGVETEIEAINGVVVKEGNILGTKIELNEHLVSLVRDGRTGVPLVGVTKVDAAAA